MSHGVLAGMAQAIDDGAGRPRRCGPSSSPARATRPSAPGPTCRPPRPSPPTTPNPTATSRGCCAAPGPATCRWSRASTAPAWPAAWACWRCATWRWRRATRCSACPRSRSACSRPRCCRCCSTWCARPRRKLAEMCLTGESRSTSGAGAGDRPGQLRRRRRRRSELDWLLARLLDKSPAAIRRGLYTMKTIETMALRGVDGLHRKPDRAVHADRGCEGRPAAFQQKRKPQWKGR